MFGLINERKCFCLILPSFSIPQLLGNELLISFSTLQLDTSSVENSYLFNFVRGCAIARLSKVRLGNLKSEAENALKALNSISDKLKSQAGSKLTVLSWCC